MMQAIGPGGFHPQMQQHPGAHPMAPGMAHNPSQPGAQPGMPQHMAHMGGVSGPGGQVNAAALMGGMPPGAGAPNAHAMQHLNPQMFQQQQQQQFAMAQQQPNMLALQQQRMIQQQRQAMVAQQMGYQMGQQGGMPMGMNQAQMNQFAAMRNGAAMRQVSLPPHLQQQAQIAHGQHQNPQAVQHAQLMAQQLAMQQQQQQQQAQQQQAANNQMHQAGQPGHPQQITQQQMQAMQQQHQQMQAHQMAQQASQQQAQQQAAQNQAQAQAQAHQGQQPGQPQQPPQATTQPPQRVATPAMAQTSQPQSAGPSPAQQPTPQQQQQQPPQQPQPQPQQQQPPQPQQQQQQPPQPQQQQQPPQQGPQPGQPGPQGQPGQQTAQPGAAQPQQPAQAPGQPQIQQPGQPQHPNPQMMAQQQMANMQQQIQQQKAETMIKGQCLLRLMQFNEHLSGQPQGAATDDSAYWQNFVNQFFSQRATFRLIPLTPDAPTEGPDEKPQMLGQFDIPQIALARFFQVSFQSGIRSMALNLGKGTIDKAIPGGGHYIENQNASLIQWLDDSHIIWHGSLRAHFDAEQKFELFEFTTDSHDEFLPRTAVIGAAKPNHEWNKQWHKLNTTDATKSPEMTKKSKAKTMKSPPNAPPEIDIAHSSINKQGLLENVGSYLEMCEVMQNMVPLFSIVQQAPGTNPNDALQQYISGINMAGPQPGMVNGQGNIPPQPRTPSFGNFGMGQSPAAAHMNLPGSPHVANTGSPAQGQMQAPGMQLQQSQQGTSSSGPSANTSPASNKRRRPSGVKTEDDSGAPTPAGGPQINGVGGAKKPATPRMAKRVKGNPA